MQQSSIRWTVNTVLALAGALAVVSAQQPTARRTVLQQGDISVPGREAVTARAEIPAGGTTGRHTHPGEEISYVLEGTIVLEVDGQPARTVTAGDAFIVPREAVHNATNKSGTAATVIATYIVDKGKPLAMPAK